MKLFVLALTLGATAASAATLDLATQSKLGVRFESLAASRHSGSMRGYARVLDPVPLASLDADIAAASAASQASQAEAKRTRVLAAADATVSKRTAETAAAVAAADTAKLALTRRRLGLEWGPAFVSMGDARRAGLIQALAAGRVALVRVDAPSGLTASTSVVLELEGQGTQQVQILGSARSSDPRLLSTGLIGLVSGPSAGRLGAGQTLNARLALGGSTTGVIIPRAAILRAGGESYVYVRRDATHFDRRKIVGAVAQDAGLFATGTLAPGEVVVTQGASALYAADLETKAKPAAPRGGD